MIASLFRAVQCKYSISKREPAGSGERQLRGPVIEALGTRSLFAELANHF
jgi:hypothetical protein